MGEVLGEDGRLGLVLLAHLVLGALGRRAAGTLARELVERLGRLDADGVRAELGPVEEERRLGGGRTLVRHRRRERRVRIGGRGRQRQREDLAAEREEVVDFLLGRRMRDVGNVDCSCHFFFFFFELWGVSFF